MYDPPKDVPFCDIPAFLDYKDNLKLIGPDGSNFKRISEMLGVEYLWLDFNKAVIRIFASERKLLKAQAYFDKYLIKFFDKHCSNKHQHLSKKHKLS